jgi:hypothetical protein
MHGKGTEPRHARPQHGVREVVLRAIDRERVLDADAGYRGAGKRPDVAGDSAASVRC